jgi:hypothetical protein
MVIRHQGEILVFGHDHHFLILRELPDLAIVARLHAEVQYMTAGESAVGQEPRQRCRQLVIHQQIHAAINTG